MNIQETAKTVQDFLTNVLQKEGRIAKCGKIEDGWEAEVEVIEENELIKSLDVPTTVYDRNTYFITLDGELNVISYEKRGEHWVGETTTEG
ncbi:gas vesicle protein [bacterium]|nr:gas vesicle protein [bacterium]